MTKITVRYFIDDTQVDEAEAEQPDEAKARELIEQSKEDLSDAVDNMACAEEFFKNLKWKRSTSAMMP